MSVWAIAVLVIASVAGCGRYGFCGGNVGPDALVPDVESIDAPGDRPNVVFVTSMTFTPPFTPTLPTADSFCAVAQGNLPGHFVAWISTSTANAIDRLAGSRGWVRTDGAPVLDSPSDLSSGGLFNPIDRDQNGARVAAQTLVWTGTGPDGRVNTTCGDWANTAATATYGYAGSGQPYFTSDNNAMCNAAGAIYCFEVGHVAPVKPVQTTAGRLLFLGHRRQATDVSLPDIDQICMMDAASSGLPGLYVAALATTTSTASSRVANQATPWRRPDGTVVATTTTQLFDGVLPLDSFVNQTADGSYEATNGNFLVGASSAVAVAGNDCNDWMNTGAASVDLGCAHCTGGAFWFGGTSTCSGLDRPLCLQQ